MVGATCDYLVVLPDHALAMQAWSGSCMMETHIIYLLMDAMFCRLRVNLGRLWIGTMFILFLA